MKNVCYVVGKPHHAVICVSSHRAYVLMTEVNRRFGRRAEYGEPGRPGFHSITEDEYRQKILADSTPAAKASPAPKAKVDVTRFGAIYIDWHMRDNVCRKRYASWAEASAAYKQRSADVVSSTTFYQTTTVSVNGKHYTYFADHGYKAGTMVVVDLPDIGESLVEVVSSDIMSKRDLEKICSFERFKRIVRKATKKEITESESGYEDQQISKETAEAFALPSAPHTYGYSTFSDDDVPW